MSKTRENTVSSITNANTEIDNELNSSIMDIDDINEMHSDAVADSTLESEIDALSKIIEESKDDQIEPVAYNVIGSVNEPDNLGNDNIFSQLIDEKQEESISQTLEMMEKMEEENVIEKLDETEKKQDENITEISEVIEEKQEESITEILEVIEEKQEENITETPEVTEKTQEENIMETSEVTEDKQEENITETSEVTEEMQEESIKETPEVTKGNQEESVIETPEVTEENQEESVIETPEVTEENQEESVIEKPEMTEEKQEESVMDTSDVAEEKQEGNIMELPDVIEEKQEENIMELLDVTEEKQEENIMETSEISEENQEESILETSEISKEKQEENIIETSEMCEKKQEESIIETLEVTEEKQEENIIETSEMCEQKQEETLEITEEKQEKSIIEISEVTEEKQEKSIIELPDVTEEKQEENIIETSEMSKEKQDESVIETSELSPEKQDESVIETSEISEEKQEDSVIETIEMAAEEQENSVTETLEVIEEKQEDIVAEIIESTEKIETTEVKTKIENILNPSAVEEGKEIEKKFESIIITESKSCEEARTLEESEESTTILDSYEIKMDISEAVASSEEAKTDDEVFHTPPESLYEDEDIVNMEDEENKKTVTEKVESIVSLTYENNSKDEMPEASKAADFIKEFQSEDKNFEQKEDFILKIPESEENEEEEDVEKVTSTEEDKNEKVKDEKKEDETLKFDSKHQNNIIVEKDNNITNLENKDIPQKGLISKTEDVTASVISIVDQLILENEEFKVDEAEVIYKKNKEEEEEEEEVVVEEKEEVEEEEGEEGEEEMEVATTQEEHISAVENIIQSEIPIMEVDPVILENEGIAGAEVEINLKQKMEEDVEMPTTQDLVEDIFKSVSTVPDLSEILEADEEVTNQIPFVDPSQLEEPVNISNELVNEAIQEVLKKDLVTEDLKISEDENTEIDFKSVDDKMPVSIEEDENEKKTEVIESQTLESQKIENNVEENRTENTEMLENKIKNLTTDSGNIDLFIEGEDEDPDLDLTLEIESEQEQADDGNKADLLKNPELVDSELESAVKFLQEAEEKSMEADSTVLSKESTTNQEPTESTSLFVSVQDSGICEETPDLISELQDVVSDPIAISEAEIISEAAKLESERKAKLFEQDQLIQENEASSTFVEEPIEFTTDGLLTVAKHDCPPSTVSVEVPKHTSHVLENVPTSSESIPQISVLEERLKEPPQIEIPNSSCDILNLTHKSSLLMSRDGKNSGTSQKSLESPRKEEADNVGSPRIILKIAKSALADCSEPRSPKSPKIRSATNSPNPEDSPGQKLGKIKLKLSKGGHPSIISNENVDESMTSQWHADSSTSSLSPLGVKIKLSKSGDASVVQTEKQHESSEDREKHKLDEGKKVDTPSPIGMKIKLLKSGDASVVQADVKEDDHRRNESRIEMKIKLSKSGDAEIIQPDALKLREKHEKSDEQPKRTESPIGMKIKLSKFGDPSIIQTEDHKESSKAKDDVSKKTELPIGVKIKLSKTGDASIVDEKGNKEKIETESPKRTESPIGVKIKLSKSGDASIVHPEKLDYSESELKVKDKSEYRDIPKRTESPIGMKIKLSKSGDASIISQDTSEELKEKLEEPVKLRLKTMTPDREISKKDRVEARDRRHKSKEPEPSLEMKIKVSKSGHAKIVSSDTHDEEKHFTEKITQSISQSIPKIMIEPLQIPKQDISIKRKDLTISPIELKKSKLETKLSQMLPEVTIQPVIAKEQKQIFIDESGDLESPVQILSREISITHVRSMAEKPEATQSSEIGMTDKLKTMLGKQSAPSPSGSDCEIIEHRPELIIVNENSNSSQDVMIIEEVPAIKPLEQKVPKKRGRPRRSQVQVNPVPVPTQMQLSMRDPLALDDLTQPMQSCQPSFEQRENERPRRTCRSQKSYAPPKRGRGRGGGRGKRKADTGVMVPNKKPRIDQDLTLIEERTTGLITLDDSPVKAKDVSIQLEGIEIIGTKIQTPKRTKMTAKAARALQKKALQEEKAAEERKAAEEAAGKEDRIKESIAQQNWLAPLSKKAPQDKESNAISTVQVIDEETRMSAESGSRSQTPARNLAAPVSDNILNEESQGSVLSTATTESEKVKVKNRRMEINFDPDEGPFTVDKIAEYEWPQDRKGETFMIQEQISQYLGVKSFKRKYPDLKRRMVDMEERNYLRENGLVSEAMCDMGMGLTAICSSEVLDVMCSDFPEQYEEYRKHMREKQVKEHSKKQKELSAAANAERNRIDLAEMAVQSAVSWNAKLNKSRQDTRKCSLDLQTFTIHVPQKRPVKIDPDRQISYYPVALIPGQYTDYYREYTPAELRYYPLNTVLYGPMKPNERKFDSQSEGSQSDSDSDSSSDDSSSSSSEGTQDTEESQSTMEEVDMELTVFKEESKNVKCKMCLKHLNKFNKSEVLIQCGTCNGHVHPSCIDLTLDMVPHIQAYAWQCTDCKTCAQCHDPADEDKMLFCDMCDRGYHIYCVGLRRVPQGRWHCQECAVCANCGSKEPAGVNADRNSVAQWQHEYKKGDKNIRVYVSTLCVPCSKLWRKGRYCPHCSRCHTAQRLDLETNLVHCSACDKYLHLDCVETKSANLDLKNYLCDFCSPIRNSMPKSALSKRLKSF